MNIQEAQIHALIVRSRAVATEVIAMQANDKGHEDGSGCYTEDSYYVKAQELYAISNEIQEIARIGTLP